MRMGLEQRLTQELRLTPQLIMNMQLLQLSSLDLEGLVRQELEENPALEQSADAAEGADAAGLQGLGESLVDAAGPVQADVAQETSGGAVEANALKSDFDYTVADLMPNDDYRPATGVSNEDDEGAGADLSPAPERNLVDTLMPRLRDSLNEEDAALARYVIESLDEDGFLTMTDEEVATARCADVGRVRSIVYALQRLEPGGLACRDTRESLDVQLELAGYEPMSLERRLVGDLWELLKHKQLARIARLCSVTEEDIHAAFRTLGALETRPARQFSAEQASYVAPDYSIEWRGEELVGVPTDESFPRLRLSQRYVDILRNPAGFTREQVAFAREKFNRALMFLRAIESRRRTLRKLTELIIERQRDFFERGSEHMKPATLRDAAGYLGVHASTVSRAIAGKYLETTFGIFPYKHFFTVGSGNKARTSIKEKIAQIIERESKTSPLSDDDIVGRLKMDGVSISRRTVAKYRDELGIPGRNERRGF
ncbi:MAG: RNA polymerase factor sigma-54 [bacterium]